MIGLRIIGLKPATCFTSDNTRPLALWIGKGDPEALQAELNQAAAEYFLFRDASTVARPKLARTRLAALEKAARELWSQLDDLDEFSKLAVRAGFRDAAAGVAAGQADKLFSQSDEDDLTQESRVKLKARRTAEKQRHIQNAVWAAERKLGEVSSYVRQLCEAVRVGRNQLPDGAGRRSDMALHHLIGRLILIYRDFSRQEFRREKLKEYGHPMQSGWRPRLESSSLRLSARS